MTENSPWVVAQLGAREHYAIPRALRRAGRAARLLTDFWGTGRAIRWMPDRLRERIHPEIVREDVTAFSSELLLFEAASRLVRRRGWPLIEARNAWFDERAAARLHTIAGGGTEGTLFAYSYAARRTLAAARQRNWKTVLGQIDPGPLEWRLVQARRDEAGLPPEPEPSAAYWDSWREECDLADAIAANSDWSREALLQEGISAAKIHVVPLAYEGATPADPERTPGETTYTSARPLEILFLGQIIVRKGILEILDAIDRLTGQPVVWTFAGGGEAGLLEQLRRRPQTRVLGPVRRQEASLHYRAADIFLLPTHSDGFAITQLEAAAYGLPIVASKQCGEVVRHGVNGILLDAVTGEAIADAVSSLLTTPHRLEAFRGGQRRQRSRTLADLAADLVAIEESLPGPAPAPVAKTYVDR